MIGYTPRGFTCEPRAGDKVMIRGFYTNNQTNKRTNSHKQNIVEVLFDAVRRCWASLLPHTTCVCVLLCFVDPILGNRYGPGVIPQVRGPGVAGSSPSTLTMSLAIPVPSSSSSNGPTTVTLITMGLCHGSSAAWAGPKFVRTHR